MVDHLANALNTIKTHEMVGQRICTVKSTTLIKEILRVFKENKFLTNFNINEDGRGGNIVVDLDGRINECGVIKPRMPVKRTEWAKMEQQYIPGVGIGLLIVSTPEGVMTNVEAEKRHIGGRLIAYVY